MQKIEMNQAPLDLKTVAPSKGFYRPELDVLRFLAFALVFVHHAMPAYYIRNHQFLQNFSDACEVGLQLFFLLSAFLISELLLRETEETGSVHLKSFYMRRILRIWPLYFFTITVGVLFGRWTHFTSEEFIAFALLAGNWFVYARGFLFLSPLGPLWSISIEEQFYLLWPALVMFVTTRILYLSWLIFVLLANLTLYLLGSTGAPQFKIFTHTLVEFQFFAAPTLLALWLHKRPTLHVPNSTRLPLALIGFGLALLFTYLLKPGGFRVIVAFSSLTASTICIFVSFYGMKVPPVCSPLIYLGKISYGLYVFHAFSLVIATHLLLRLHIQTPLSVPVAALLLTVGIAALSYRYIEEPFLRLKRRFTFIPSRPQ